MGIIVNTSTPDEYNEKIGYYRMNGFIIEDSSINKYQTRLSKKNYGPVILHILLIVSLIGFVVYCSQLALYTLSFANMFIPLSFFSLLISIKYLQDIGIILLIVFIVAIVMVLYYYFAKPYEVLVRLNTNNLNMNNRNNFNPNGGNNYVG